MSSFIADIPVKPSLTRLKHIRPVHDLASVLLHRESFTDFEGDVLASYQRQLNVELPGWAPEDLPDERSVDYITRVFKTHLPRYEDTPHKVPGNDLAIVVESPKLIGTNLGEVIDSHRTILRVNHKNNTEHTHKDIGLRSTIHLMDEYNCYNFTRSFLPKNNFPVGSFNIFSGGRSDLAACLEYARYLDCGGDSSSFFVLKPSFRGAISVLAEDKNPSIGFIATAFGLRLFDNITVYGFDSSEFEREELLACSSYFENFRLHE